MMTTNECVKAQSSSTPECCMCGDEGLSNELFNCKICQFRYQHRYCSNLYPKAECYKVCNWCLYQKNDTTEKTQNSSNSSFSHKNNVENNDRNELVKIKIKRKSDQSHQGGVNGQKGNLHLQGSKPIKKRKVPEKPIVAVAENGGKKTIGGGGGLKDRQRRTKSEDISNSGGKKVIRSRVRRYKLLEEVVSSQ